MTWDEIEKALAEQFPPTVIHWRPGATTRDKTKAQALAYIDARDVMNRLDSVVGWHNWQRKIDINHNICRLGIRHPDFNEWVWKDDVSGDTNIEAEKGGASRAFVRAAVNFGIGRYLYDLPSPWMPLDGKRFSEETEKKLLQALQRRYDMEKRETNDE